MQSGTSGLVFLIPVAAILGVFAMIALGILRDTKIREMRMRERIAMIEHGMAPPPEVDPEGFERRFRRRRSMQEERFKSGGIMLLGLGAAIALIIGVAGGQATIGLGIGSAIGAIGLAMIAASLLSGRTDEESTGQAGPGQARPSEGAGPTGGSNGLA